MNTLLQLLFCLMLVTCQLESLFLLSALFLLSRFEQSDHFVLHQRRLNSFQKISGPSCRPPEGTSNVTVNGDHFLVNILLQKNYTFAHMKRITRRCSSRVHISRTVTIFKCLLQIYATVIL